MNDTNGSEHADSIAIGVSLKTLRKQRGWSLSTLAKAADVSVGLLSQIERGRSIPSLRTLTKLRLALNVSLGELVQKGEQNSFVDSQHVVRREGRRQLVIGENALIKEFLSSMNSENLNFMLITLPPGGSSGPQTFTHDGEKAGFVIEGNFTLNLGSQNIQLRPGDSFHFDSSIPHSMMNGGDEPARFIWIICRTRTLPHL
ncbi:cupin domain-containing protein [Mesorhizobium sp. 1B3]|uniref:cupin domain-containing protein n=1 Tax=Mesorhizobium sp. 1B3 TaxID=3243599 RepID=UPI003D95C342